MLARTLLVTGVVLLVLALVAFLAAGVALSRSKEVEGIAVPPNVELSLPAGDPLATTRRAQAEQVVLGSVLLGGVGVASLFAGWRLRGSRQ